jgi:hypothetical protein
MAYCRFMKQAEIEEMPPLFFRLLACGAESRWQNFRGLPRCAHQHSLHIG